MNSRFVEKRATPTQEESMDLMRRAIELALQNLQKEITKIKEWQKCHGDEARPLLEAASEIVALAHNLRWLTTARKWAILIAGILLGMTSVAAIVLLYHDSIVHALTI